MKKHLSILAALLCIYAVFFSAVSVKADTTQTPGITTKNVNISMVTGETKPIPDINLRCSAYSADTSIVTLNQDRDMVANNIGKTTVTVVMDNEYTNYHITVTNQVDIVIAMGQSNMCGSGGNISKAPVPKEGTLQYADQKLTSLTQQGTLIPAFANEYHKQTGVPVVMISYAVGGSSSEGWLKYGLANKAARQLKECRKYLKKNKVQVRHIYMLWYQGETDAEKGTSEEVYMSNMRRIYKKMHAAGVEKCMVIRIGEYRNRFYNINSVVNAQNYLCGNKKDKKNFVMVSKKATSLSQDRNWYTDNVHFCQEALNKIGKDAGKNAAKISRKK